MDCDAGPFPWACLVFPSLRSCVTGGRRLRDDEHGFLARAGKREKEAVSRGSALQHGLACHAGIDRQTGGLATQRGGLRPRRSDAGRRVARSAEAICRSLSAAATRTL